MWTMEVECTPDEIISDTLKLEKHDKIAEVAELAEVVEIKQELSAGICWGCLEEGDLKDMNQTYFYKGKPEVYSELISYCFSIQVGEDGDSPDKPAFICETCVTRLREAANFRTQIEVTRNTFKSLLEDDKSVHMPDYHLLDDHERQEDEPQPELEEWLEEEAPQQERKPRLRPQLKRRRRGPDSAVTEQAVLRVGGQRRAKMKSKASLVSSLKTQKEDDITVSVNSLRKKNASYRRCKRKEELPYQLEKTDLECKICGETFPVHKGLQMHMPVHFPNHICEQCGRWFATRTQLSCHTVSHTTAREACPICPDRVFKATGSLKAHMRRHTGQMDIYKCSVCTERFTSYNARRRHLVSAHGEENKKYACKHCTKRFCLQSHLSVHIRSIHLQERSHNCLQCDSSFFSRRGLMFHMLKHTGERRYECAVCKKRYGRKYTLKEHMKIHTGERAHVCYVCGKAFTQRCTLKGHMAVHEKEMPVQTKFEVV